MARRTDNWYELRALHEDELRDSREYVARLVDFVESRTGGLLKQRGWLQPGPQGTKVIRILGRISCFVLKIVQKNRIKFSEGYRHPVLKPIQQRVLCIKYNSLR